MSLNISDGTQLGSNYTVVDRLGQGIFADVFRVRHRYLGIQAMKVLRAEGDEEARAHGLREAFLLSQMSHPGIVRVFDAGMITTPLGERAYLTMELIEGGTLEDALESAPRGLQTPIAMRLGLEMACALGWAHSRGDGLIHRDIKPSNILMAIDDDGQPHARIADFGLCERVDRFTKFAEAKGTLLYLSPESLRGYETPASDVWSAGMLLYQMLTGTLPYPGRGLAAVTTATDARKVLTELQSLPVPPPSYFDSDIPPAVDELIAGILVRDEFARPADGNAMARKVGECMSRCGWSESPSEPIHTRHYGHGLDADDPVSTSGVFETAGAKIACFDSIITRLRDLVDLWPEIGDCIRGPVEDLEHRWSRFRRDP